MYYCRIWISLKIQCFLELMKSTFAVLASAECQTKFLILFQILRLALVFHSIPPLYFFFKDGTIMIYTHLTVELPDNVKVCEALGEKKRCLR